MYGKTDCMLFIADIDLEVMGFDPAADYRGKYADRETAMALLGARGVIGAMWRAAKQFGWRAIDPAKAAPGDRGLVLTPQGPAGVICAGEFWMGPGVEGMMVVRAAANGVRIVKRAWGVI